MQKIKYKIIIEADANPDNFELRVAFAVRQYFKSDIVMRRSNQSYSPDILVLSLNQLWEIKNIRGNGVHTIEHNLSKAKLQSENVIISLYRTKMQPRRAIGRIKSELKKRSDVKRLILVTKQGKIIVIK